MLRTWKARPGYAEGAGEAKLNGYLEDYADLIEGLLELYQTTLGPRWFMAAQKSAETMLEHFADSQGTLYDTSDDHEILITHPRDLQDNATSPENAVTVTALSKPTGFTNELRYIQTDHQALAQMQSITRGGMMSQHPLGFGQWLQALSHALSKPREIAIVGDPDSADTQALLTVVRDGYRPFQVVALGAPDPNEATLPLLRDRRLVEGQGERARPAAYVCDAPVPGRAFACRASVTGPQALKELFGLR